MRLTKGICQSVNYAVFYSAKLQSGFFTDALKRLVLRGIRKADGADAPKTSAPSGYKMRLTKATDKRLCQSLLFGCLFGPSAEPNKPHSLKSFRKRLTMC